MTEISELTGMSRPTLYQLQTGKAGDDRDPTVTLLNALGGLGPQTAEQLAGVTRIAETIVARTIEDLVARQLVSIAVGYYTAGSQTAFVMLTEAGVELLQTLLTRPE